jgi:hypothetical protein
MVLISDTHRQDKSFEPDNSTANREATPVKQVEQKSVDWRIDLLRDSQECH